MKSPEKTGHPDFASISPNLQPEEKSRQRELCKRSNHHKSMDAFRKVYPVEFYNKFLEKSVRPDGRSLSKFRKTYISSGSIITAMGSSFVRIGQSSVVAGIKCEPSTGIDPRKNLTHVIANVELTPLSSSKFVAGKPSEQATSLSTMLTELLNRYALAPAHTLHLHLRMSHYALYMLVLSSDALFVEISR
jgi:exosome complex component RRP43